MNIKTLILTFFLTFVYNVSKAQVSTYTFIDPCTKEVTIFSVPIQGGKTMIIFLNNVGSFDANDLSNGTFSNWVNQVYTTYRQTNPCSQQQGQVTQNQITAQIIGSTVQSVVSSILSSSQAQSSSLETGSSGSSDAGGKDNKNSDKKKNNNNQGNGSNSSQSNTTNNSTTQNGGQSQSNSGTNSTNGGSNSTQGSGNSTNGGTSSSTGNSTQGGNSTTQPSVGSGNSNGSTPSNNSGSNNGGSGSTGSSNNGNGSPSNNGGSNGSSTTGGSGTTNGTNTGNNGSGSSGTSGNNGGSGGSTTTGNSGGSGNSNSGGTGTSNGNNNQNNTQQQGEEVGATTQMNNDAHNDNNAGGSGGSNSGGKGKSGGGGSARSNPIIVSSDVTSAQNLNRTFTPIVNIGTSKSSMTGLSSYGVTGMVWLNFKQFAVSTKYTKIHYNKTKKLKFIHNINLTGVYTYGNYLGFIGYSGILNGGKYGITGFNVSAAATIISEEKNGYYSPSITAFYTRPFKVGKKLIVSPELYVISTPLVYSSKDNVSITDRYVSGFIGSGFDYQISKRFKLNVNYKANMSTNPEFPILSFFLVGSKINL
jgi:hypothetical protein